MHAPYNPGVNGICWCTVALDSDYSIGFFSIDWPWYCWIPICSAFSNSEDPDQFASGSALFVIKYVNLYQQPGSSNVIDWKLEVGMAS